MSDFVVPDMIDPIVAWRCWNIDHYDFLLQSINGTRWLPQERLDAECPWDRERTITTYGWWLNTPTGKTWYRDEEPQPKRRTRNPSTAPVATSSAWAFVSSTVMRIEKVDEPKPNILLPPGYDLEYGCRHEKVASNHGVVPKEECNCGIYALAEKKKLGSYRETSHIFGEVYLWGNVVLGEKGYRASYAYPKAFYDVPRTYREHLEKYGVPVLSKKRWVDYLR